MSGSDTAYQQAFQRLSGAGTWHELRRSLSEDGLESRLTASDMQTLLGAWHAREAGRLSDAELTIELKFWADGGRYETHLAGYQAVAPAALVGEAEVRGWFVRRVGFGALVNPPDARPLTLRAEVLR